MRRLWIVAWLLRWLLLLRRLLLLLLLYELLLMQELLLLLLLLRLKRWVRIPIPILLRRLLLRRRWLW